MKIVDLGQLDGPIVLFGGVYSNLQAFMALKEYVVGANIAPNNCICTGDVVAYCGNPYESIEEIRNFGCPVLAGNCEKQLGWSELDCGCGFEEGSTCSLLSVSWYKYANKEITNAQRDWMKELPDRISFNHAGKRHVVVHGGASDISKFIWPVTEDSDILREVEILEEQVGAFDVVIAGHTGIAMNRNLGAHSWLNSGAIGMPANDGTSETSFAVLTDGEFVVHRLNYDAQKAQIAMQNAGLTQGYDQCLLTGHWPSEETLPVNMRYQANG